MSGTNGSNRSTQKHSVFLATVLCLYGFPSFAQNTSLAPPTNLRIAVAEVGPYQHVVPGDVRSTVGVGVSGPAPTKVWTASTKISVPGTIIENTIVNGCLDIYADNVTIRNVVVNCGGLYPIDIRASNIVVEHSKINCTSESKAFLVMNPGGSRISRNEISGCEDFFYIDGNVDGMLVEDNYMHSAIGPSSAHSDGFQIGERSDTYGTMTIRGNYIWQNNPSLGSTDIVFVTNHSRLTLLVENNFLHPWGAFTLRCTADAATNCMARNNIYSLEFLKSNNLKRTKPIGFNEFTCNRYEDGVFLDANSGDPSSCPPFIN